MLTAKIERIGYVFAVDWSAGTYGRRQYAHSLCFGRSFTSEFSCACRQLGDDLHRPAALSGCR